MAAVSTVGPRVSEFLLRWEEHLINVNAVARREATNADVDDHVI